MTLKTRARMSDVAELAGVGTMTVSRVISGSVPVSDETRARVLAAIAKLDYHPNEVARSLREARTRSIGVIVPNFYDTFFASCAHAVTQVARREGYSVAVTTSVDAAAEYHEASLMMSRGVDGLIVIPAWTGGTQLGRPEFASVPIVTLEHPLFTQPTQPFFRGSVVVDNARGARLAVEHLISHGHRSIVYLSLSNDPYTLRARHSGYEQCMREAGLSPEGYFTCATPASTVALLKKLRAERRMPTAIFTSNNLVTQHALHALAALKLAIPKHVAVVGFDDLQMFDIFKPSVTVVRQPVEELGRIAAEMLLKHLQSPQDGRTEAERDVVLPVELVVRRSCGCKN